MFCQRRGMQAAAAFFVSYCVARLDPLGEMVKKRFPIQEPSLAKPSLQEGWERKGVSFKMKSLCSRYFPSCFFMHSDLTSPDFYCIDSLLLELKHAFYEKKGKSLIFAQMKEVCEESEEAKLYFLTQLDLFLQEIKHDNWTDFLVTTLFPFLDRELKNHPRWREGELLELHGLFSLVDSLLEGVQDQALVRKLQVHFANLPYPGKGRTCFKHLYFTEEEQSLYLLSTLQQKEDALVEEIVDRLQGGLLLFSDRDIALLEKLLQEEKDPAPYSIRAIITQENKEKLAEALQRKKERSTLEKLSSQCLEGMKTITAQVVWESKAKTLKRVAKCKSFIQEQKQRGLLPSWWHSIAYDYFDKVLEGQQNTLRFSKAPAEKEMYSSNTELYDLRGYGLVMSNQVQAIYQQGIEKIRLQEPGVILAVFVPNRENKEELRAMKKHKLEVVLHSQGTACKVMSVSQANFLLWEVRSILGRPNLPLYLWGRAP